jgi:hypothetical protein
VPPQPARESRAVVASNGPTWKLCITKFRGRQAPLMTTLPQRARFTPRHEYHNPGLASSQGSDQPNFTGVRLQRQDDRPCRADQEGHARRSQGHASPAGATRRGRSRKAPRGHQALAALRSLLLRPRFERVRAASTLRRSHGAARPSKWAPREPRFRPRDGIRAESARRPRKARNSGTLYRRLRSRGEPSGRASTALANVLQTCRAAGANILQTLDRRNHAIPDETTTPIPRTFGAFRLRSPAFADN